MVAEEGEEEKEEEEEEGIAGAARRGGRGCVPRTRHGETGRAILASRRDFKDRGWPVEVRPQTRPAWVEKPRSNLPERAACLETPFCWAGSGARAGMGARAHALVP
ncbi:unnamed protein product [Prorocentrum cordatum]|uniref:Uncharacterized protein n=1 Tax=Prorocentrum cordatum TaxID=2364126 RepID=A0ABN9PFI0_9DINO|nr:unnamed protein product [Polarella glacialis]